MQGRDLAAQHEDSAQDGDAHGAGGGRGEQQGDRHGAHGRTPGSKSTPDFLPQLEGRTNRLSVRNVTKRTGLWAREVRVWLV
ncbi:hypothetical protein GCM10010216_70270 [Streptomyces flaveolus]|nr:hypothetical protein GCM10010216_70270 [Streptomyces flaveolus]